MLSEIESAYNAYMENSKILISRLKSNQTISETELQNLRNLTNNIQNAINTLVEKMPLSLKT
ncbi:hypothetical protein PL321_04100 [Caloramator sp. mosi_1]|uniref:hypothetical protein n=1 Tax=Caloramator sp. mosi_1 TaxID=3023090 RepID=UPI0023610711|nr:hypothetical protein [Caloramator sp. mosi_1]WDC84810.1 hypothetical protein PL321_04100 [Caloramator sp. mosi_1]